MMELLTPESVADPVPPVIAKVTGFPEPPPVAMRVALDPTTPAAGCGKLIVCVSVPVPLSATCCVELATFRLLSVTTPDPLFGPALPGVNVKPTPHMPTGARLLPHAVTKLSTAAPVTVKLLSVEESDAIVRAAVPSFSNSARVCVLLLPTATLPSAIGVPEVRTYLLMVLPLMVYSVPSPATATP